MVNKVVYLVCALCLILSACGPGQLLGPTLTSTPTITSTPTTTYTPLPTDTATPTLVIPQVPITATLQTAPQAGIPVTGQLAFQEQFLDNSRGWAGHYPGSQVLVQNGNLNLKGTQPGKPLVAYCANNCNPNQDRYYYQVAIVEEGPSTLGLGLVFGLDHDKDSYYAFKIRPSSGDFSLVKLANAASTTLVDWRVSTGINPFPQPNTIGVSFQGGIIDMYINGVKVASYVDMNPLDKALIGLYYDEGGIGLLASSASLYLVATPFSTNTPLPSPVPKFTPTPSPFAGCYPGVPPDHWVLMVTKAGFEKGKITINGVDYSLEQPVNVFYLELGEYYLVKYNGNSKDFTLAVCKVVYLKIK